MSILFLLVCTALSVSRADTYTVESSLSGEQEFLDTSPRTVTVHNEYDVEVFIFFDNNGEHAFLTSIPAGQGAEFSTYLGHRFVVKDRRTSSTTTLESFIIVRGVDSVTLKPATTSDTKTVFSEHFTSRPHPNVVPIRGSRTTAQSVKFRSLSSRPLDIWFDNGADGSFQGSLKSGQETTTTTYAGHVFYFTVSKNKSHEIARFTMTPDQVFYVIYDDAEHSAQGEVVQRTQRELAFMKEYFERTGIHWRANYGPNGPRPPPVLHMWNASSIGQVHKVVSKHGFWNCFGKNDCQSKNELQLDIEVISLAPRAFIIDNFLSDYEADHIIEAAKTKVKESTVGSHDGGGVFSSDTRTSRNTWISRNRDGVMNTISLRAADVLNVDESLLHSSRNAEDMQVVHYVNKQKYDAHHDWGVSGYDESRFITMLLYLTDQADPAAGGETSFPKAGTGGGIKVVPKKGMAVLFYNLLEDGNGDDLSLHAALPVLRGEKWLSNFWVWDPKRK